jgi:hypothetical protein
LAARKPFDDAVTVVDDPGMTWTAPAVDRNPWPTGADDRASLEAFLDHHRRTLLWKCQGLTGEQLASRPVPSTTLSLLGLLRHLAEVERGWFRRNFGPQADVGAIYCTDEYLDADLDLGDPARAEEDYATYLREIDLARQAAATAPLDAEFISGKETLNLRWVYLHMLEEYARHNGHADLLREAIDGATGE